VTFGGLRLLLAAAALAAPGVAAAQTPPVSIPIDEVARSDEVRREGDGYRHLPSNFLFPASLGAMPARKLIVYGPADVSIQYTLKGGAAGDGWIDLYVYRKDVSLAEEAAMTEELILDHYAAKRIVAPTGFAQAVKSAAGGWYDATIGGKPHVTHYQLSHHGEWAVKARFSMPVDAPTDVRDRAAAALASPPTRWR
jgi:hypothetical protein